MDVYNVDYDRVIQACEKRFGGKFAAITRLHPNIAAKSTELAFGDTLKNGSFYPDMQELMVASDIIITDYSSVMFDFALTGKPCFQYAADIDAYKGDRNFYFEIDKLPFVLAEDNDALEQGILNFDSEKYAKDLNAFYTGVGMVRSGDAAQKCAELVIDLINNNQKR